MDDWEKFNKISYSHLHMNNITDTDYAHTKRVCKDFEIKNFAEYHDMYVPSDTFLLLAVFNSFQNRYFKKISLTLLTFFLHQD